MLLPGYNAFKYLSLLVKLYPVCNSNCCSVIIALYLISAFMMSAIIGIQHGALAGIATAVVIITPLFCWLVIDAFIDLHERIDLLIAINAHYRKID